jgi:hypothetical protein
VNALDVLRDVCDQLDGELGHNQAFDGRAALDALDALVQAVEEFFMPGDATVKIDAMLAALERVKGEMVA